MQTQKPTDALFGILGGMGPLASAHVYLKVIEIAQKRYGAVQDTDYPHILLNSIRLSGFDETGIVDTELVRNQLKDELLRMQQANCRSIVMACNTVHVFYDELQALIAPKTELISLPKEASTHMQKSKVTTVGLLSSASTRAFGFYQQALAEDGMHVLTVTDQQQAQLDAVIEHVMGGTHTQHDSQILVKIADSLVQQGADAILLGCTELPLAWNASSYRVPVFNTITIAATAIIDRAYPAAA